MDEHRPFWEIVDEPEQSQHHEEEDEQQQAVPRAGLWLWSIDPVKFHRRIPHPFQPLHEGTHSWERPRCGHTGGVQWVGLGRHGYDPLRLIGPALVPALARLVEGVHVRLPHVAGALDLELRHRADR